MDMKKQKNSVIVYLDDFASRILLLKLFAYREVNIVGEEFSFIIQTPVLARPLDL